MKLTNVVKDGKIPLREDKVEITKFVISEKLASGQKRVRTDRIKSGFRRHSDKSFWNGITVPFNILDQGG